MQIFARLTKVNEADRTVEGIIASEAVDRSGEVFDYDRSKPHFKSWSEDIAKATEGKNLGNVRVMHGNAVAGVTKVLNFDDTAKQITVKAEIVDDNEWKKVQKGCYTGFSIGGKYGPKWEDPVLKATRYEAIPNEYSLVDLPCNPEAQFTVIKSDGSEELRKFETTLDNSEALVKWAAGLTDAERAAVLEKVSTPPAATEDAKPADLRQQFAEKVVACEKSAPVVLSLAQLAGKPLEKGMYAVADLAEILCTLGWITTDAEWEAQIEGDDSPVPSQLREAVKQLGRALVAMATEEASELAESLGAEKGDQTGDLAKAADDLQKALASVDAIGKALGCAESEAAVEKATTLVATLTKVTGERDTLQKDLSTAKAEIETLKKRVEVPKGAARVIEKNTDNTGLEKKEDTPDTTVRKVDGSVDQEATARNLVKAAHANPIRIG